MKRIVFLACIGSLTLVLTAWGAPKGGAAGRGGGHSAHVASARGGGAHFGGARMSPHFGSRGGGRSFAHGGRAPRSGHFRAATTRIARGPSHAVTHSAVTHGAQRTVTRGRVAPNRERNVARVNASRSSRAMAATTRNAQIAQRNARMTQATRATARRNLAVNRQRNLTFAHNVAANRAGDTRIVNNWRSDRFRSADYAAFYNYNRPWHERAWWNNNFTTIVFVSGGWWGGWWGWYGGYWYPAWGYDPYAWYPYDGPIYTGYATLTPNRVVVEVQTQLRANGYYAGSTDGVMGTQTRAALAAFQADNGLAVTSTIDKPTLQTLGLT
jgi:putative peptidoglycan binding protein